MATIEIPGTQEGLQTLSEIRTAEREGLFEKSRQRLFDEWQYILELGLSHRYLEAKKAILGLMINKQG